MFDPDKSGYETLMEIAITTLVIAALLFLAGIQEDPHTQDFAPIKNIGVTLPR